MDMIWTVINSQPKPKIVVLDCLFCKRPLHSEKNDSFAKPSNCRTRPSYFELAHSESVAVFFWCAIAQGKS